MIRLSPSLAVLALSASLALGAGPCPGPGPPSLHPETLVVFNANAGDDALTIASYYTANRGIAGSHLCPVDLPVGQFASKDHLLAARKTIVESCICTVIPVASRPVPCNVANIDAVRLASPITHLAIIRGIPARLYGTPWPTDLEEPSFDFYLAYLIYRNEDIFAVGTSGQPSTSYLTLDLIEQANELMILSAPPLSTALHRDIAYGRIEAIDRARTLALIDRTLEAERLGITGNFFEERNGKGFTFLRNLTGSLESICSDYQTYEPFLFGAPASSWPEASCRAASTWTSAMGPNPNSTLDDPIRSVVPGSFMSTVPLAVNAGLMLGSAANPNGHAAFNDFATLVNWRHTSAACTPLCSNLATQAERDQCTAASGDYFHELDTSCVGAARGFIGHQTRSYPVQYYGFHPANWLSRTIGSVEKTPPEIRGGGAFQGGVFADDRYLHVGQHAVGSPDTTSCTLADGSVVACPERVALAIEKISYFTPALAVGAQREFLLRLRYRNQASPGGALRATLTFTDGTTTVVEEVAVPLDVGHDQWQLAEALVAVQGTTLATIQSLELAFATRLQEQVVGFLDLDGVELIDVTTGQELLGTEVGSFDPPAQNATHPGDYAANAIDRLGAVAWWGSSSHHLTGGYAFNDDTRFYGAFFMGRTLGESLVLTTGGQSGIIYGDPLYRPVAVRMHIPGQQDYGKAPGLVVAPGNVATAGTVQVEVLHGTDNENSVQWTIASCGILDPSACDVGAQWIDRIAGTGSASGLAINWTQFLNLGVEQDVLLRLRVWNPGQESDELFHYAYFHWHP